MSCFFKVSLSSAFHTAYTVLFAVMFFKISSCASVASGLLAQPTNIFPARVGVSENIAFSPAFTVNVLFSFSNLPPLASKTTVNCSLCTGFSSISFTFLVDINSFLLTDSTFFVSIFSSEISAEFSGVFSEVFSFVEISTFSINSTN